MFTGIVTGLGRLAQREATGDDARLLVEVGSLPLADPQLGESISVNGVCLTVQAWATDGFWADVSQETLRLTTLGSLPLGAALNLERALQVSDRLGGHLVSGHVDGVARIAERVNEARSVAYRLQVPTALQQYIAAKGSVTLDGVSLTVNAVQGAVFGVNIVPHTQAATALAQWQIGTEVNVEVDVLARYLERLLSERGNG